MSGALHLSEDDTWNTTPRVLVWMYQGFKEAQESMMQQQWEMARFQAYINAATQGAKIKSAKDLIAFPWESDTTPTTLTKEDVTRLKQKFK